MLNPRLVTPALGVLTFLTATTASAQTVDISIDQTTVNAGPTATLTLRASSGPGVEVFGAEVNYTLTGDVTDGSTAASFGENSIFAGGLFSVVLGSTDTEPGFILEVPGDTPVRADGVLGVATIDTAALSVGDTFTFSYGVSLPGVADFPVVLDSLTVVPTAESFTVTVVPEPASALLLSGLAGSILLLRRRKVA